MCLTQRRDTVELCLMHEHVHIDGAGVELFGPQEVKDGGEQGGVPVNENLRAETRDTTRRNVKTDHPVST